MGVKVKEKDKGSGVWWLFINHRGTRKAKKIGDKKLAMQAKKEIEARLTIGDLELKDFNKTVPTFRQVAETWLALPNKRCAATNAGYVANLENHIYPVFGSKPVDSIKRGDLKVFFDGLGVSGMSESNFLNIKTPMSHIFQHSLDREFINTNPLAGLKFTKKRNIVIQPLTADESVSLLEQAQQYRGGLFYPHLLTLSRTGMRVGELCGLKWEDINFADRTITIQRTVYQGKVGPTKNRTSRVVDMSPMLADTLKARKHEMQKMSLKRGRPFSEWVFTFNHRTPMNPLPIRRALDACLKAAGLPHCRVHDLRHSYATQRLLRGHNINDVSYQLGHSSISITHDVYTHWIPSNFKSQVDDLDTQPSATQPQPASLPKG